MAWKGLSGREGGKARWRWEMSERPRGEMERVWEEKGWRAGWVGRCHFRYSMEPALCEHVGNTTHTDGAIKKMMSGKSRNYTRLTRGRLVLWLLILIIGAYKLACTEDNLLFEGNCYTCYIACMQKSQLLENR